MALNPYPGTNPLTYSTTPGAGAPGVVVNSGAYGVHTIPMEANGNDARTAGNLMAIGEANRDSIVWLSWHAVDWINGGTYDTLFRSSVTIANNLTIDRSYSAGTDSCLVLHGPTGAGAYAADIYGSDAAGRAARFGGGASATMAVEILGGLTTGDGLHVTARAGNSNAIVAAGHGSKPGVDTTGGASAPGAICKGGTNQPAVKCDASTGGGFVQVLGNCAIADDPGQNALWGNSIPKAWAGEIVTDGMGGVTAGEGLNVVAVAVDAGTAKINVSFTRALSSASFGVTYGESIVGGNFLKANTVAGSKSTTGFAGQGGFSFSVWNINGGAPLNLATSVVHIDIHIDGRM